MKWLFPRFIIPTLLLFLIIVGGTVWFFFQHQRTNTISINGIPVVSGYPPTPGLSRTTYTNHTYGYSFVYPSAWRLKKYTHNNVDTVQAHFQVIAGDSYPFEVDCQANPNGLNAQSWFTQMEDAGTGIGYITLQSGETAYFSAGHAQVGYTVYTFTHNHAACAFSAFSVNAENDAITNSIVNSFHWL